MSGRSSVSVSRPRSFLCLLLWMEGVSSDGKEVCRSPGGRKEGGRQGRILRGREA